MEHLSANFTLGELIESATAARLGIDNSPTEEQIEKLRWLASNLEQPRALLGPLHVDSALRVEALEKVLCDPSFRLWCARNGKDPLSAWPEYFARKQHPKCEAADVKSLLHLSPVSMCRTIAASAVPFDQLIYEFDSWMHVSFAFPPATPRREILTVNSSGTFSGIVESTKEAK